MPPQGVMAELHHHGWMISPTGEVSPSEAGTHRAKRWGLLGDLRYLAGQVATYTGTRLDARRSLACLVGQISPRSMAWCLGCVYCP